VGLVLLHSHDPGDTVPHTYNGMAAHEIRGVRWLKSSHSNSQGTCAEFAKLPSGEVAMRNSRFPEGPALVYTTAEMEALLRGVKDGEFDDLIT
jgi:hypothetical protein